ncbi:MAG: hypothetical protein WCZ90_14405 [Melioribacteraceae bacterium]
MKKIALVFAATVLVYHSFSCKESITDSRPRVIRPPQEMIWTADTLKGFDQYAQLTPENLLVFASNDAWLVCWSDIARRLIWHFDGKSWTESNIAADVGGMRVRDIAGNSSSDLWACGYTGDEIFLAHYNGSRWTKYNTNGIKGDLLDMCKDAEGDLWACGRNGMIMKYDKTKWIVNQVKLKKPEQVDYFNKSIAENKGKILFLISSVDKITLEEKYYYASGTLDNWVIIDSMTITNKGSIKWGYRNLFSSSNQHLYSCGMAGIWSYENSQWKLVSEASGAINNIFSDSDVYTIAVGDFKKALFSNGITWSNFSNILNTNDSSFVFKNVWTNGYETFICGYGNFGGKEKLVVWRGN